MNQLDLPRSLLVLGLLVHFQYEDGSIVVKIPKERWFNKLTVDSILTFMQRDVDLATFLFLLLEWCASFRIKKAGRERSSTLY